MIPVKLSQNSVCIVKLYGSADNHKWHGLQFSKVDDKGLTFATCSFGYLLWHLFVTILEVRSRSCHTKSTDNLALHLLRYLYDNPHTVCGHNVVLWQLYCCNGRILLLLDIA